MSYLRKHPELLARFRAGDQAAQLEVYRVYVRLLDRLLRRGFTVPSTGQRIPPIKRRSDRADAIQEAFARAFQPEMVRAYDGVRDYLPLLVSIALNAVVSQHRRHGRELPSGGRDSWAEGELAELEPNDEPEHAWQDPMAVQIMREYVASLPEPMRAFHAARHVEGLTEREVAARLGITRWRVQVLERRMRKDLLALLKRAGLKGGSHG